MVRPLLVGLSLLCLSACATSPLGHSQLLLFSPEQVAQMGEMAFQEAKQRSPITQNTALRRYVTCVAGAIIDTLDSPGSWEVQVFADDTVNAFALPGGKVGIYTGLLRVTANEHQLAAVIGHEIAHVLANHSNARLSTTYATQMGLSALSILSGAASPEKQQLLALLGLGAQVGILLPYSRDQESEADLIGLELMARAGFDPRESIGLWQNMGRAGGPKPPEFLSTHPSGETRINSLQQHIPKALAIYEQARAQGRDPHCTHKG